MIMTVSILKISRIKLPNWSLRMNKSGVHLRSASSQSCHIDNYINIYKLVNL